MLSSLSFLYLLAVLLSGGPVTATAWQLPFLNIPSVPPPPPDTQTEVKFQLRHIIHHGADRNPNLFVQADVSPVQAVAAAGGTGPKMRKKTRHITRPESLTREDLQAYRQAQVYKEPQTLSIQFNKQLTVVPDVTHKHTVLELAKVTSDAYIAVPGTEDWIDIGGKWNISMDFGWDTDGLRGHVFVDEDEEIVVVGIKGTSPAVFDGRGTTTNDKINDNLLFSCCCARVSWSWTTVCDCYRSTYTCDQTCLERELVDESRYYSAAINIFYHISSLYPNSTIWMAGHSLGGAMAALTGLTFGLPTVTFEAPGERLAAKRLHLPLPPGMPDEEAAVWHFGHTADPIYMGVCNGAASTCSLGGYAMETHCHTGLECVYDVVRDKGWRVAIGTHRIKQVIDDVILEYDDVPKCEVVEGCVDCYQWDFVDNSTEPDSDKRRGK